MGNDTPVKNEKNEFFHLACADRSETLTVLKESEIDKGDTCHECENELVYHDPDVDEDDDD